MNEPHGATRISNRLLDKEHIVFVGVGTVVSLLQLLKFLVLFNACVFILVRDGEQQHDSCHWARHKSKQLTVKSKHVMKLIRTTGTKISNELHHII